VEGPRGLESRVTTHGLEVLLVLNRVGEGDDEGEITCSTTKMTRFDLH
jgi:hypothetical protein